MGFVKIGGYFKDSKDDMLALEKKLADKLDNLKKQVAEGEAALLSLEKFHNNNKTIERLWAEIDKIKTFPISLKPIQGKDEFLKPDGVVLDLSLTMMKLKDHAKVAEPMPIRNYIEVGENIKLIPDESREWEYSDLLKEIGTKSRLNLIEKLEKENEKIKAAIESVASE